MKHDPAYGGREMQYQAIGAAALFAETNLREDEVVQFRCLDGFVASISKAGSESAAQSDRVSQRIGSAPIYPQSQGDPIVGRL